MARQAEQMEDFVPRGPRWDCEVDVPARDTSGKLVPLRISNMSNGGFMAESDARPAVGTVLTFELPGEGEMQAEIRWAIGNRFGALLLQD